MDGRHTDTFFRPADFRRTMQQITDDDSMGVVDLPEKPTVTCMSVAYVIGDMLRTFVKNLVSSVEERYRMSQVKLDEWVVVELEPEFKLLTCSQPMKNRLWVDVPDYDEE